jgi:hypothetical protein
LKGAKEAFDRESKEQPGSITAFLAEKLPDWIGGDIFRRRVKEIKQRAAEAGRQVGALKQASILMQAKLNTPEAKRVYFSGPLQ